MDPIVLKVGSSPNHQLNHRPMVLGSRWYLIKVDPDGQVWFKILVRSWSKPTAGGCGLLILRGR